MEDKNEKHNWGTEVWSSINANEKKVQSRYNKILLLIYRRDDLESIAYISFYLILKELPWYKKV